MKKLITAGISIIACAALCAAVRPRSAEVQSLPAELVKSAVNAKIEARSEETSHIFISADMPTPVAEAIAESEPPKTEITAEKETEKPAPTQTAQQVKPTTSSFEPHNGDVRVVDGEKQIYILGFG
jgi:outer membrane biosynthesis protein TonB